MGSWVGVELMAQCAAALAGLEAWRRGCAPRVGFLLGVRRYRCTQPAFLLGQRLRVEAEREFEAGNGVGAARCRILAEDQTVLSEAAIAVFQPEDPRSALGSA
jgi:predicted hotdog family 3-hydroxylacyl-ACP dehydratase